MDFEVHYNDEFFEVKTRGDAELGGFEEFIAVVLGHEQWKPGAAFLVDHSELNVGPLTVADVRDTAEISARRRAEFGRARVAILVSRNLEYGMAGM